MKRAVVLAGRRSGDDPLARAANAPHRALLDIEGRPMLLRVVERLLARASIERVLISIDEPSCLEPIEPLVRLREAGRIEILHSDPSPSVSVAVSLARADLDAGPVLVTTADHALLDDAMLDAFLGVGARPDCMADLLVGLVSRRTIEARFPQTQRTYLRFRDDAYSGANLFLFRRPAALRVTELWARVENDRKRPWRLARAFGLVNLALFVSRRLSLDEAMTRASRAVGARVEAVRLTMAEAAVDVDKLADLELVRAILAERRRDEGRRGEAAADQSSSLSTRSANAGTGSATRTNPPASRS